MLKKITFAVLGLVVLIGITSSSADASRLPVVGGDNNTWGFILNEYLNGSLGINATNLTVFNARVAQLVSCSSIQTDSNGFMSCGTAAGGNIQSWLLSQAGKFTPNGTGYLINVSDSAFVARGIQADNISVVGNVSAAFFTGFLPCYFILLNDSSHDPCSKDPAGSGSGSGITSWLLSPTGKFTPNGTGYLINVSDSAFVARGIQSDNISVVGNITSTEGDVLVATGKRHCFDDGTCLASQTFNGTCIIMTSTTTVFNLC